MPAINHQQFHYPRMSVDIIVVMSNLYFGQSSKGHNGEFGKFNRTATISLPDEHITNENDIEFRSLTSCNPRYPPLLLNSESPVDE